MRSDLVLRIWERMMDPVSRRLWLLAAVAAFSARGLYCPTPASAQACASFTGRSSELAPAPDGASPVPCAGWDGIVDRDIVFDGACTFYGQVQVAAPHVTLDCRGGAIDGTRIRDVRGLSKWSCPATGCRVPGVTVIDRAVPLDSPLGLGTPDELTHADPSVEGLVIQNCEVRGFSGAGISLRRQPRRPDPDGDARSPKWEEWWRVDDGEPARLALRHELAPRGVVIRNVTVRDNGHVGIYVWPFSEGTRIERSRIEQNRKGGIYLDAQSRRTRIEDTVLLTEQDPAVQIDSSPENLLARSCIGGSRPGALGVLLFRNCGEAGRRRWYESRDNRFEGTLFEDLDVGLWIASRQGLTHAPDRPPRDCIDVPGESFVAPPAPPDACIMPFWWDDPGPDARRFRDHAGANVVVGNRFDRNGRAVIVWDDTNVLRGNELRDSRVYDICVGQAFREAIGEPLRAVLIEDNLFVRTAVAADRPHVVDAHRASPHIVGSRYRVEGPLASSDPAWCAGLGDMTSSAACSPQPWSTSRVWMP